ncbi:hypothetical protein MKW92_012778 [Papaver armeniacum]|nr:hypothetical protein MKW92_012778 [Papaver armeniacum]
MALYEKVSSKQEFDFCEALDKIEAFTFRPYDDNICGVNSRGFGVGDPNCWSRVEPSDKGGDINWDFIASVTPCFLSGFFGGDFNRFFFNSYSVFVSNFREKRQRPIIGRRLMVTRVWRNFWAHETKALKSFCSSHPVRDAASDVIAMHHSGRITIPLDTLVVVSFNLVPKEKAWPTSKGCFQGAGSSDVPEPHTPIADPVLQGTVNYVDGSGWSTPEGCYGETPCHGQGFFRGIILVIIYFFIFLFFFIFLMIIFPLSPFFFI